MSDLPPLHTDRLLMRPLRDDDIEAFAALHADPRMMQPLGGTLSRPQSEAVLARIRAKTATSGLGPWGVELPGRAGLIGLVGLARAELEAAFTPCVEISWRLAPAHWGQGYATEAARAALDFGFRTLALAEILAWTTPDNRASRRVMEKIGMARDPAGDFDHPRLPQGHPLRRHVLYRVSRGGSRGGRG
jgi:RimJ/RimL family protein N-acetyltransferase